MDTRKASWFLSLGISSIIYVIEIDFLLSLLIYNLIVYVFFDSRGRGATESE